MYEVTLGSKFPGEHEYPTKAGYEDALGFHLGLDTTQVAGIFKATLDAGEAHELSR